MLAWNHPAPAVATAHRFDHWPITDRSRGQRLVHPSITRHLAAPQGLNHGIPKRPHGGLGGLRLPSPARKGTAWVTPNSHPYGSLQDREPGKDTRHHLVPQPSCGPIPTHQPGGRSPRSGSQPQPGQLPHQPPAANPKLGPQRFTDHPELAPVRNRGNLSGASVRSLADHRPFTRSAARSSVDHPPLGGTAGAKPRDTKDATRRP
jgi:hypothetical protein